MPKRVALIFMQRLDDVRADRGSREEGKLEQRLSRLCDETDAATTSKEALVFCGACGIPELSGRERAFLQTRYPDAPLRSFGALFGHSLEAQFITGLALASLALDDSSPVKPMAPGVDAEMAEPARSAIVTTIGHTRGEGVARLSKLS
jgi:3-oxoacyl-[acyl-carrier-protein] synthase II